MARVARGRVAVLALALLACASRARTPSPAPPSLGTIEGLVSLAPAVRDAGPCKGRLFATWVTLEEVAAEKAGTATTQQQVAVMFRTVPLGEVDLCIQDVAAPFVLRVPPGEVQLRVMLDVDHLFMRAQLRGDAAGTRLGSTTQPITVASGKVTLAHVVLDQAQQARDFSADCVALGLEHFTVAAPEVAGRVGNPTQRGFCVALPAEYATQPDARFPVVYLLPGLTGTHVSRFRGLLGHARARALTEKNGTPVILVGVDTSTRLGSTYFEDTPHHGAWASFALRLVKEVDARYRTVTQASGRAVMGHSTGGLNALILGMRHPDVFGVVVASSPDPPDFTLGMLNAAGTHLDGMLTPWLAMEDRVAADGQLVSWAAEWSGDDSARGYAWPAEVGSGRLKPDVWKRWLAHSPTEMLKDPKVRARLTPLSGNIMLTAGTKDEFGLHRGAQAFSAQLQAAGVANTLLLDEHTHSMRPSRFDAQLGFVMERFAAAGFKQ